MRHLSATELLCFLIAAVMLLTPGRVSVQDDPQRDFDQAVYTFREQVKEMQDLSLKHILAESYDDAARYIDKYDPLVERGNRSLEKMIDAAKKLFDYRLARDEKVEDELFEVMTRVSVRHFEQGRYERAYELAKRLLALETEGRMPELVDDTEIVLARSGLLTNRFDKATADAIHANAEFFQNDDRVSAPEQTLIINGDQLAQRFAREQQFRAAEEQRDDLPRVEFETTRGNFTIELFEEQVPNTVANFINLVEAGHYNGLLFHVVIDKTVAETGAITENYSPRAPDFTIEDESSGDDIRHIFAGSTVMVSEQPDSGAARFFIALAALPGFDQRQTCFGRIIAGMDNVNQLAHTFKIEDEQQIKIEDAVPDRVLSAKVIRKRDHSYQPQRIPINRGTRENE